MIDLTEMNIMFTLNGEMLISDSGSEMAFKDVEIGEGEHSCSGREKNTNVAIFSPFIKTCQRVLDSARLHSCVQSGPLPNRQD